MSRSCLLLVVAAVMLGSSAFAQSLGTPSLGWVTVTGPAQAYDSGYVDVGVYSYQAYYSYSPGDTVASVLAGLKTAFDSPSSPVAASIAGNVLSLTSKATGSGSNSSSLFAIYFGASFSATAAGMVGGRDGPRNFRMFAYDASTIDADVNSTAYSFGDTGKQLPPGHSIIGVFALTDTFSGLHAWWDGNYAMNWNELLANNAFDVTRIDAVNVDEPYLQLFAYKGYSVTGDPCGFDGSGNRDPRYADLLTAYTRLQAAAAAIKQSSPTTKFWVNFEANELGWMQNGSCAFLNAPYIDVVSLDDYKVDFVTTVKPYYDWLLAHPGYPGQQIALVPGTFVGNGSNPAQQNVYLEEFFDYATSKNQSCTSLLGSGFVTGIYDGCPVWLVAGFVYNDTPDGYIGLVDPAAAAVQAAWFTALSNSPVDHGLPAIQILAVQPFLNQVN